MITRLEPHSEVIKILGEQIKKTQYQWARLPAGSVSFDAFNQQPLPISDIERGYFTKDSTTAKLAVMNGKNKLNSLAGLLGADENTNLVIYGANSCMGWHTNSDMPGDRVYYTFTMGKAVFRYINSEGNIVDDIDNIGWTVRRFPVRKHPPLWHTIWTEKLRFSFGFWIKDVSRSMETMASTTQTSAS